jgi:hypothetical protein
VVSCWVSVVDAGWRRRLRRGWLFVDETYRHIVRRIQSCKGTGS